MTEAARSAETDLELVAEHGSSDLIRALAVVQLARRRDRLDELEAYIEEEAPTQP